MIGQGRTHGETLNLLRRADSDVPTWPAADPRPALGESSSAC